MAFLFERPQKGIAIRNVDARTATSKRQLARARSCQRRLGYQVRFSARASSERFLRQCESEAAIALEIPPRESSHPRLRPCRTSAAEIQWRCLCKVFHQIPDKSCWF